MAYNWFYKPWKQIIKGIKQYEILFKNIGYLTHMKNNQYEASFLYIIKNRNQYKIQADKNR